MGKLINYIMLFAGLMIFMNLAGLATTSGYILGQLGVNIFDIENFSTGTFQVAIIVGITSLLLVSGIKIGIFGAATTTTFAAAAMALPMAILIADMTGTIISASSTGNTWVSYIIFAITVPLILGYGIALFDWVRGIE